MLKTQSNIQPQPIVLSTLGKEVTIRMATNIEEKTREEDDGTNIYFEYNEVVFKMPHRDNLQKDIEENFDIYFSYGIQYMEQQEVLKNKKSEVQRLVGNSELPSELQILMLSIAESYEEMMVTTLENSLAIAEIYERLEG